MDKYFIASIAGANSLGNKRVKKLVDFFGNGRTAWSAEVADLKNCLTPKALEYFLEWRQTHPDAPERLADYCQRNNFGLCTIFDEDYPPLLKEISLPPATRSRRRISVEDVHDLPALHPQARQIL